VRDFLLRHVELGHVVVGYNVNFGRDRAGTSETLRVLGARLGFGAPYFVGIAVAAALAGWHYTLIRDRSRDGAFRAFRLNHWIGFAVFAGVVGATTFS
jgi:4-hydroxybenzoate polyprenyltransferase